MLVIKNLSKSYGDFTLKVTELSIEEAGVTLLWGPSGAGKSSLLRLLLGLEEADQPYTWICAGKDLSACDPSQREIGVVFQHLALFPHLTARENILFPLRAKGLLQNKAQLQQMIELLGMGTWLDKKVHGLSGGEKQRVALARALVLQPKVLFMDEPFSSLDLQLKKQARALLKATLNEYKVPLILVSHDLEDARELAQRVVVLEKGRIKASQTRQEFLDSM